MTSIAENHSPSITFAGGSADFPIVIADDPAKSPTQAISPVTAQKSANKTVEKKSPEKGPKALTSGNQEVRRSRRIFRQDEGLGRFIIPPRYLLSNEINIKDHHRS
ncbi:hypothetical protein PGTUg99_006760 [Puccinia graminis f. sp. tritici]|uniref:Uncharacterized protein n=1 Tax=Puccinia graminis f. sp. tritici TaxID=56615 RepID=A0A5B0RSJ7_PUCGR|nr:hypothetical protein PGTUg99_006760 [Puccinia graminis f. sp. tritici]